MPVKITYKTKIRFNGKEYQSADEMPADVRQAFERALAKGRSLPSGEQNRTSTKLVFNGKEYNSPDEMPAEIRGLYEQVLESVDRDHNGIPDALETGGQSTFSASSTDSFPVSPSIPSTPGESNQKNKLIMFGTVALVLVIVLIGMVILLTLIPSITTH